MGSEMCIRDRYYELDENSIQNYIGTKIGDVNQTAVTEFTNEVEVRTDDDRFIILDDKVLEIGESLQIPIVLDEFVEMKGMQVEIRAKGVMNITSDLIEVSESNYSISEEGVKISIDLPTMNSVSNTDTLFMLEISSETQAKLSDVISIADTRFESEIYIGENLITNPLNLRFKDCLLYTSPSPRDLSTSRMPSSA